MPAPSSGSQRAAVLTLLIAFCATALAADNPYDKFRDRSYSNRSYLSEEDEVRLGAEVHE